MRCVHSSEIHQVVRERALPCCRAAAGSWFVWWMTHEGTQVYASKAATGFTLCDTAVVSFTVRTRLSEMRLIWSDAHTWRLRALRSSSFFKSYHTTSMRCIALGGGFFLIFYSPLPTGNAPRVVIGMGKRNIIPSALSTPCHVMWPVRVVQKFHGRMTRYETNNRKRS